MNRSENERKPLLMVFPFEQLAHYLRCLTLAKKLAPHFEIRVAHSERYGAFVQAAGFQTFSCESMDMDAVLDCVKRFDFSWLNLKNLERSFQSQVAAIQALQPALVLGDAMPTLSMAAEQAEVPYVSLLNGYMTKHFNGVRTMSWRYPLYKYFRFLPRVVTDPLTKEGEALTLRKIHQPFATLRRQYGLLKKYTYPDEGEGDLNLICDLPELFPQHTLPANYTFIPPLVYQAENNVDAVLKKLRPGKRTLFVSMGSTGDWQDVSFLNNPHFQQYNIITAGDAAGAVQGTHVIRTAFAAVEPLFRHVDLVLCHGGNGTIYQALSYGIPLLCKTAHFEQEWNVQALQQHGVGASLDTVAQDADYIQLVDVWSRKKDTNPFRAIQQRIRAADTLWEPVVARIAALAPLDNPLYYKQERKSA